MARIRGRDTTPERIVRSILHRRGLRFRVNVASLPGKPDVVLARHKTVVLVHGCFWHSHSGCDLAATPRTNRSFWEEKLSATRSRDRRVAARLRDMGWRVVVAWECTTRTKKGRLELARRLWGLFK